MPVPTEYHTARLVLRRWCADDAVRLQPILEANVAHLKPWIPSRVAEPASIERLGERLAGFASAFDEGREWRYGIFTRDVHELLGEVGLFPRAATGRVPFELADRLEIGYFLRNDATGQGFATEAAQGALEIAMALGVSRIEIRCDERNAASAAVPRRLGFQLADTLVEPPAAPDDAPSRLQVWEYPA
jgi:RimJ/RimL family protein N-acetyltransferase